MKRLVILSLLVASGIAISLNSCVNKPFIPATPQVSFAKDVYPIIIGNCTQSGCHSTGSQHGGGEGFSMSNYNDVISFGEIVPGNANKSKLYNALINNGENLMPKTGQLPDNEILTIYLWIEQGAQNN